ncbi:MAG: response regulator [Minicystis sp.]
MRGRHSVLVVGDGQEIRHSLRNLLLCEGFDVHLALDGIEALKLLDRQRIDAAVIDLMMPRLDGVGVCHALLARPEARRPPVVFVISAHGEMRRHLDSPSVRRVFPKPIDPREIATQLMRELAAAPVRRSA